MKKTINNAVFVLLLGASSLLISGGANAQEWPFVGGDYWEVTGIDIKDGGGLTYANWLANEWRKNSEFAKSKGWIKDYMVFSNVHPRGDEPDIYLVRVRESIVSGAEGEKRQKEYMTWVKKTLETLVDENGNRAEYRTVMGDQLLQAMKFRN